MKSTKRDPKRNYESLAGILKKPSTGLKSPSKMPSIKEQRKRWKLVDGMMIEMGSDE